MTENKHKELLIAYHSWLGYDPSWAKERVGAKRLLKSGYTIDNIKACYYHYKDANFWNDKHLSLTYIASNIDAWAEENMDDYTEETDLERWYRENN